MSGEIIAVVAAAIALAAVIVPGQRSMRNDIKHLLTKTSGLDGRLDAMDGRLGAMDGRLNAMDGRLDAMEGCLGSVERRVTTVRTEVAQVETRLTSCIGKLEAALKERLARLEGYFEAMGAGGRAIRKRAAK
ncbi:MAG: hypothetical protein F4164_05800 [Gemmatimonadales bacterium]|nr:hypothetical protein [Gemmatimonadales bacterium]MYG48884.1 hypothetical protein [Gemmatimonadales bacterium]MYK02870.1 hypothetical protein [Candidatus Palauibacter ramosifaciens]